MKIIAVFSVAQEDTSFLEILKSFFPFLTSVRYESYEFSKKMKICQFYKLSVDYYNSKKNVDIMG